MKGRDKKMDQKDPSSWNYNQKESKEKLDTVAEECQRVKTRTDRNHQKVKRINLSNIIITASSKCIQMHEIFKITNLQNNSFMD